MSGGASTGRFRGRGTEAYPISPRLSLLRPLFSFSPPFTEGCTVPFVSPDIGGSDRSSCLFDRDCKARAFFEETTVSRYAILSLIPSQYHSAEVSEQVRTVEGLRFIL